MIDSIINFLGEDEALFVVGGLALGLWTLILIVVIHISDELADR